MANSNTTTPSLTDLMPTNNDLKPWSTTDIPVLSPTLYNYYDWSSIVQAMVDFHDATTSAPRILPRSNSAWPSNSYFSCHARSPAHIALHFWAKHLPQPGPLFKT
jgi:hypothetical protein